MSTCTWTLPSLECDALLLEAQLLTNELDVYDLYNTCNDPASPAPPLRAPVGNTSLLATRAKRVAAQLSKGDPANCFGSGPTLEAWFNQPAVKAALHVAPRLDFALCASNFSFNYNSDIADERTEIYPLLLNSSLKVTICALLRRHFVSQTTTPQDRAHVTLHPPSARQWGS